MEKLDETIGMATLVDEAGQTSTKGTISAWRYRLAVVQHYRSVYRVAQALLRNAAEAEDVTQDTFVRYWQHGAAVERVREWLMKVARNGCLDRLRKAGRYVSSEQVEVFEEHDDHDPAWHYEHHELADELQRAVASLTEPQRSLVVLFDMQGMSADECARVIGINVNQVKVYLHRARRRLRLKLEESR